MDEKKFITGVVEGEFQKYMVLLLTYCSNHKNKKCWFYKKKNIKQKSASLRIFEGLLLKLKGLSLIYSV